MIGRMDQPVDPIRLLSFIESKMCLMRRSLEMLCLCARSHAMKKTQTVIVNFLSVENAPGGGTE